MSYDLFSPMGLGFALRQFSHLKMTFNVILDFNGLIISFF